MSDKPTVPDTVDEIIGEDYEEVAGAKLWQVTLTNGMQLPIYSDEAPRANTKVNEETGEVDPIWKVFQVPFEQGIRADLIVHVCEVRRKKPSDDDSDSDE